MATVIDGLIDRQEQILAYLQERGELSLALEVEANFKKLLVIACGSFFETELIVCLEKFACANAEVRLSELIRNKALKRQYHTMFDWEGGTNANRFFGMFGASFKDVMTAEIRKSRLQDKAMRDFLALGAQRNLLAHGNLAALVVDNTLDELKEMYRSALSFFALLQSKFSVDEKHTPE